MNEEIENLREKAYQLWDEGKWEELIPVATKLINLEKEPHVKAIAYCIRGSAYLYKGEYNCALENFNEAEKLNPKNADAYCGLGYAYINKNEYDCALKNFNEAIKLDPEHADAYCGLGTAYIIKENFSYAITAFNTAIEKNPEHVNAYYACGITYLFQSDFGNAFKKFKEVLEKYPILKTSEPFAYITSQISEIDSLGKSKQIKAFKFYINLLTAVSEIQHELFYTSKELKSGVAHYTSLQTLENLSERGECFRLYNADGMNDPEEGQVFFKIMNEEYRVNIEKWFYEGKDKSYRSPAYIGSFVLFEGEDKLSLWRNYGKHDNEEAAGACLIFNEKQSFAENMPYQYGRMKEIPQLIDMMRNNKIEDYHKVQKLALYKIYYRAGADNELKEELKKLGRLLEDINELIKKVAQKKETKNTLQRLARELLDSIRFLFKERYYSDEKERRVIQLYYGETNESSESKIKVDAENISPRFYTEALKKFRFSGVILGRRTECYQEWEQRLKGRGNEAGPKH